MTRDRSRYRVNVVLESRMWCVNYLGDGPYVNDLGDGPYVVDTIAADSQQPRRESKVPRGAAHRSTESSRSTIRIV